MVSVLHHSAFWRTPYLTTESQEIAFPTATTPSLCSWSECLNGHRFVPTAVVATCSGCGAPTVAIQKTNCPYCNEPTVKTVLRSDFIPKGGGMAKRCSGETVNGESVDIELARAQWREIEGQNVDFRSKYEGEKQSGTSQN